MVTVAGGEMSQHSDELANQQNLLAVMWFANLLGQAFP